MNEVLKALADPTRRAILRELRRGERSAEEIDKVFSLLGEAAPVGPSALKATS